MSLKSLSSLKKVYLVGIRNSTYTGPETYQDETGILKILKQALDFEEGL